MKSFNKVAAQGDVFFTRKDRVPTNIKASAVENGRVIVTHSETGHNHSMVLDRVHDVPNVVMYETENPLIAWLQVNRPTALDHQRPHDTHESIMFKPGVYEVRRQREYDHYAELIRAVAD
ncbi:hypothetical protein GOZ96_04930 [Agrobacterium vitis]|uniref:Uncharacterized protein n=1 Tax=Agrobacterium vitis TaxID=373 RepID=A0A7J4WX09_AGRVI|nr:hypothetical protein [Agrobacterium vitis]KAA3518856.1 hypothetical protein DXT89_26670 [Agrobacterium vitis]MUZ95933.1 hypothetical protein [Agrobacterium vitis]